MVPPNAKDFILEATVMQLCLSWTEDLSSEGAWSFNTRLSLQAALHPLWRRQGRNIHQPINHCKNISLAETLESIISGSQCTSPISGHISKLLSRENEHVRVPPSPCGGFRAARPSPHGHTAFLW